MKHLLGIPGILLLVATAAAGDEKILWERADAVLAKASATGKPVIWYFINNAFSKDSGGGLVLTTGDSSDKAFTNHIIVRHREPFLWVRGDQTLATTFKVQGAPAIVITDPDGDVIHRASIKSPENLYDAMNLVLKEKYVNTPVAWGDAVHTGPIKKRLLVLGFDDEKEEALKSLEDRSLVKYHKSCEFVKLCSKKGGECLQKWDVDKVPSVVICDAAEHVLERVSGKLSPLHLKLAMIRALAKLDKPPGQGR